MSYIFFRVEEKKENLIYDKKEVDKNGVHNHKSTNSGAVAVTPKMMIASTMSADVSG